MATFLFVGLDANYDADIERLAIFPKIVEYHKDAVSFWEKHGVHHPFLLPGYNGDGKLYHRSFARIGFGPEHANLVSFVELLHVPTSGRSSLRSSDLDAKHLAMLHRAMLGGAAKHIFVSPKVAQLMRETAAFDWLFSAFGDASGPLRVLCRQGNNTVYSHYHFSVYGKFQKQKDSQAVAIRKLLIDDKRN